MVKTALSHRSKALMQNDSILRCTPCARVVYAYHPPVLAPVKSGKQGLRQGYAVLTRLTMVDASAPAGHNKANTL